MSVNNWDKLYPYQKDFISMAVMQSRQHDKSAKMDLNSDYLRRDPKVIDGTCTEIPDPLPQLEDKS